jgi:hypothetical protein
MNHNYQRAAVVDNKFGFQHRLSVTDDEANAYYFDYGDSMTIRSPVATVGKLRMVDSRLRLIVPGLPT